MSSHDAKVYELIDKIKSGDICLPEMQRRYVWKAPRVRDLLDSLYRGYPSGTILTWEPDEEVTTRHFAIKQSNPKQNRFQLLLDGQQRLTSLHAIMEGKPVHVRDRKKPIDVLFNLEHPDDLQVVTEVNEDNQIITETNEEDDLEDSPPDDETVDADESDEDKILKRLNKMAFVVHMKKLASLPHWVSVTEVFKESSDKPFLKKAGVTSMEDERYDKYTDRLKKLRDIKNYEYRVHVLGREKSYEEVTEIFVRVNSLGAKLRSSDLALAQITAKWRNSLKIFQEFEDECKKINFDLDLAIHLKNLVAFATGQSRFRAVSGLKREALEEGWNDSKEGMDFALNFLKSNVKIDSPALLSSPFLVVAIAFFAHHRNFQLSPADERQLRYWVLTSNAKGRYSRGSTETLLDQDLAAIRKGEGAQALLQHLKTQVGRLEVVPSDLENRNKRSAYFKTMFLAFREDNAMDWRDGLVIALKHTGSKHSLQIHHIFPRSLLEDNQPKEKINDICNLAFISGRANRAISNKEPAKYLPCIIKKIGADALTKQCIPNDQKLWKLEAYDDFLKERRKHVAKRLNEFLGHEE